MLNFDPQRLTVDGIRLTREQTHEVCTSFVDESPWRIRLTMLACFAAILPVVVLLFFVHPLLAFAAGPLCVPFAWRTGYLIAYRRQIREGMRQIGYVLCPACGHSLKGLGRKTVACPECGERLDFAPWYHEGSAR